jgi:hypothetical protein
MNNVVVIHDISATQAIELKYQLVNDGLRPTIDFDWEYTPSKYSGWSGDEQEHRLAKYTFVNDSLASFYRLKWTR